MERTMLITDGCSRRTVSVFWAASSTGRALGVAWRDISVEEEVKDEQVHTDWYVGR